WEIGDRVSGIEARGLEIEDRGSVQHCATQAVQHCAAQAAFTVKGHRARSIHKKRRQPFFCDDWAPLDGMCDNHSLLALLNY
ncbi:MAG: hypothetical protein II691_00655, partial [Muribaculaceae bacterium]|nr:hypothetical protein [Muribaculaceae bacterium]